MTLTVNFSLDKVIQGEVDNLSDVVYETYISDEDPVLTTPVGVVNDAVIGNLSVSGALVEATVVSVNQGEEVFLESKDPAIANISGNVINYVSDGVVDILARTPGKSSRRLSHTSSSENTGGGYSVVTGYLEGSLGAQVVSNVDALISGKAADNASQGIFSGYAAGSYNGAGPIHMDGSRNPANFVRAGGLDTTGISAMIANLDTPFSNKYRPGCLLSNRHLVGARHYHAQVGEVYVFMRDDGSTEKATVLQRIDLADIDTQIPDQPDIMPDICITYLDRDMSDFPYYKVMPRDWYKTYSPTLDREAYGLPPQVAQMPSLRHAVHNSQGNKVETVATFFQINNLIGIENNVWLNPEAPLQTQHVYYAQTADEPEAIAHGYLAWGMYGLGGDSGGPNFLPLDLGSGVELVYLGSTYSGYSYSEASFYIDSINQAMVSTAEAESDFTGYAVVEADLSGFNSFVDVTEEISPAGETLIGFGTLSQERIQSVYHSGLRFNKKRYA